MNITKVLSPDDIGFMISRSDCHEMSSVLKEGIILPHSKCRFSYTTRLPLELAVYLDAPNVLEIISLLVEFGANMDYIVKHPISIACLETKNLEVIRFLLIKFGYPSSLLKPILPNVCFKRSYDIALLLVQFGANIEKEKFEENGKSASFYINTKWPASEREKLLSIVSEVSNTDDVNCLDHNSSTSIDISDEAFEYLSMVMKHSPVPKIFFDNVLRKYRESNFRISVGKIKKMNQQKTQIDQAQEWISKLQEEIELCYKILNDDEYLMQLFFQNVPKLSREEMLKILEAHVIQFDRFESGVSEVERRAENQIFFSEPIQLRLRSGISAVGYFNSSKRSDRFGKSVAYHELCFGSNWSRDKLLFQLSKKDYFCSMCLMQKSHEYRGYLPCCDHEFCFQCLCQNADKGSNECPLRCGRYSAVLRLRSNNRSAFFQSENEKSFVVVEEKNVKMKSRNQIWFYDDIDSVEEDQLEDNNHQQLATVSYSIADTNQVDYEKNNNSSS